LRMYAGIGPNLDGVHAVHHPNDQEQRRASRPILDALAPIAKLSDVRLERLREIDQPRRVDVADRLTALRVDLIDERADLTGLGISVAACL
jgi:hypothetical protein